MTDQLEQIKKAIKQRRQVCLLYTKPDKPYGLRYGNPYAVYPHPSTKNIIVDFWQTGGVSERGEPIPGWRRYLIDFVFEVVEVNHYAPFPIVPGYNSQSGLYRNAFAKVKI